MIQKHFSILAAALCTAAFFGGTSECSAEPATQYDTQEINKLIENVQETLAKQKEQIETCKALLKKIEAKATKTQESAPLANTIPPAPPMAGKTETGESQSNTPKTGVAVPPPPSSVPPPPPANLPPPPVPSASTATKGATDLQSALQNVKLKQTNQEAKTAHKANFVNDIAAGKGKLRKSPTPPPVPSASTATKGATDLQSALQNVKLKKVNQEAKTMDKANFVDDIAAGKGKLRKSTHQRTNSAPAALGSGVDDKLAQALAKRRQKLEAQR